MTNNQPRQQYEIGMVGLGIMGRTFHTEWEKA